MTTVTRVLQVHTRYRQRGGEDEVVDAEQRLLESAGIEVRRVQFDNAELREDQSILGDLGLAASTIWSRAARSRVRTEVREFRPEVVHVHNTFAAASPSVIDAPGRGTRVVATLHNYRLICPAATAFRDGRTCLDCLGQAVPWPGIQHACVRGSRAQSAVSAAMLVTHRLLRTWQHPGALIALTDFQRRMLISGGLPESRIRVIPNFLEPDPGAGAGPRAGVLFAGRFSLEKGIQPLLEAAVLRPGVVRVAGDGPLSGEVAAAAVAEAVGSLGRLTGDGVRAEMARAIALVVPSLTFEGFPMVVLESFASGTPVIASRIGSLAEIVEDGVTGLLVEPGNAAALADRLQWAVSHPAEMQAMGQAARRRYESEYRGEAHLRALLDVYAPAASGASTRPVDA